MSDGTPDALRRLALTAVLAVGLLAVGGGTVAAHPGGPGAGASFNCDDGAEGGGGSVYVPPKRPGDADLVDRQEARSMAAGAAHFAQNYEQGGENHCDGREPEECQSDNHEAGAPENGSEDCQDDDDYVQASAGVREPYGAQVCYSDDNDDGMPSEDNVNVGDYGTEYCR